MNMAAKHSPVLWPGRSWGRNDSTPDVKCWDIDTIASTFAFALSPYSLYCGKIAVGTAADMRMRVGV
jgi:hypothetical protein